MIDNKKQMGDSVLNGMEFLRTNVQQVLANQAKGGAKQEFVQSLQASLEKLSETDLIALGNDLNAVREVTGILLLAVSLIGLKHSMGQQESQAALDKVS